MDGHQIRLIQVREKKYFNHKKRSRGSFSQLKKAKTTLTKDPRRQIAVAPVTDNADNNGVLYLLR